MTTTSSTDTWTSVCGCYGLRGTERAGGKYRSRCLRRHRGWPPRNLRGCSRDTRQRPGKDGSRPADGRALRRVTHTAVTPALGQLFSERHGEEVATARESEGLSEERAVLREGDVARGRCSYSREQVARKEHAPPRSERARGQCVRMVCTIREKNLGGGHVSAAALGGSGRCESSERVS